MCNVLGSAVLCPTCHGLVVGGRFKQTGFSSMHNNRVVWDCKDPSTKFIVKASWWDQGYLSNKSGMVGDRRGKKCKTEIFIIIIIYLFLLFSHTSQSSLHFSIWYNIDKFISYPLFLRLAAF